MSLRSLLYKLLSRVLVEAEMPALTAKVEFESVDPGALKSRYDDGYLYIRNVCKEGCIQIRQHLRHPKHMMGTLLNMQGDKHWLTFVLLDGQGRNQLPVAVMSYWARENGITFGRP